MDSGQQNPPLAHKVRSDVYRTDDVLLTSEGNDASQAKSFADLQLHKNILQRLTTFGFEIPSPIQYHSLPSGLHGLDLVVQAKAGTGKTLVYVLTALQGLAGMDLSAKRAASALILAPTREIAVQGARTFLDIGGAIPALKVHTFIGGMSLEDDIEKLKKCHVAIGTPGRVLHLIESGYLNPGHIKLFALDEADKLMEPSFLEDVSKIFSALPENKQVVALSATYPESMAEMLEKFMRSPKHIRDFGSMPSLLKLTLSEMLRDAKIKSKVLFELLNSIPFSQCLVFSNYSIRSRALCDSAESLGWPAIHLSGAQDQLNRLKALSSLKKFTTRVLFATDLAARGIDAHNVDLVIQFDIPKDPMTYMHRIGRAGRYGTRGLAVALTPESGAEFDQLKKIVFSTKAILYELPVGQQSSGFDFWKSDVAELTALPPLEYDEEAMYKEKMKPRSKEKPATKDEFEGISAQEVYPWEAAKIPSPATGQTFQGVKFDDPNNVWDSNGQDNNDFDYGQGDHIDEDVASHILEQFFSGQVDASIPTIPENAIGQFKEGSSSYIRTGQPLTPVPQEHEWAPKITPEVSEARATFLQVREESFQWQLGQARSKLEQMQDIKKTLELMLKGQNPIEVTDLPPFPAADKLFESRGLFATAPEALKRSRRARQKLEKAQSIPKFASFRPSYFGPAGLTAKAPEIPTYDFPVPLPHPNPNRLLMTKPPGWNKQWYQEVVENSKFIEYMVFREEMNNALDSQKK